jgi:lysozyme family protein
MRKSAQEQKPTQEAETARSTTRSRSSSSQSQAVHPVLQLQRTLGNQAVQRILQPELEKPEAGLASGAPSEFANDVNRTHTHSTSPVLVQSKSKDSTPEDIYEQEADRVADQVMHMPGPETKRARANDAGEMSTPSMVHEIVSSTGRPLDPATRGFMESRFGQDFSQVRVHTGSPADDAARAVQARAFTLGHDIVFGHGEYAPHETGGQRLLAHELTHVIQQRPGVNSAAARVGGGPAVRQHATASGVQRQKAVPAETKDEDAAFWEWWKNVVGFEGSYDAWKNNPGNKSDKGGETNWGVTKKTYLASAKALGLPPTDEGFAAMTPDQAMRFGRMIWKASGANKVKNTGVALVMADWYWGGIDLGLLKELLKKKGRAATFNMGKPDDATIAFINTLSPGDLVDLMSEAKEAQYRNLAKTDPSQQKFLVGWLKRNEERRKQAQPFVSPTESQPTGEPAQSMSLWERGQRALGQARRVLELGDSASSEDRKAAKNELWAVVAKIEEQQKTGFAHAEEEMSMKTLKGELLKEISRMMNAGT